MSGKCHGCIHYYRGIICKRTGCNAALERSEYGSCGVVRQYYKPRWWVRVRNVLEDVDRREG